MNDHSPNIPASGKPPDAVSLPGDSSVPLTEVPLLPQTRARLFPGTRLVLRLTGDVLPGQSDEDRRLVVATLRDGWESQNNLMQGVVYQQACLARVLHDERLPCGGRLATLLGISRVRIVVENLSVSAPVSEESRLRCIEVRVLADVVPAVPAIDRYHRRAELLEAGERLLPPRMRPLLQESAQQDPPLGVLCDLMSSCLPLTIDETQALLAERNVDLRSDLLLDATRRLSQSLRRAPRSFPPPFAFN